MSHEDTTVTIEPTGPLKGTIAVPGDKSVSHRSLLLGALADGPSRITGLLRSGDVQATQRVVEALGATVTDHGDHHVLAPGALTEPVDVLDCGNSGTTIRLTCGWLAAEPIHAVLTGDPSLRSRPMGRVATPLRALGAQVDGREGGRLAPLSVRGGEIMAGTRQELAIASAQVKTCLLLAGRKVGISVREPRQSRDHTERMLAAMGAPLVQDDQGWLHLRPVDTLSRVDVRVPRDLSAAAFWLVGGCVVPGSELHLPAIGTNPTRAGVLDALLAMGADIEVHPHVDSGPEPLADLVVRHGALVGTQIAGELALRCLDELPVLAVAAAFAEGTTVIADAAELRVKESDRISRTVAGLRSLGVAVEERPDGMVIEGGRPTGPSRVDADGDHRIAMAFAIAACVADGGVAIDGAGSVSSSYPQFFEHLDTARSTP